MSGLKLFLLGPPRFECGGALLEIDIRKNVALVAYLAVTGEAHSREALVTLLWPETEPGRARAGLRRNLSMLKKVLGDQGLLADRDTIGLDPEADIWLDVDQFRQMVSAGKSHGHSENEICPDCLSTLTEAVALYRGDFLEGFSLRDSANFDDWQFFEAEALRRELASSLERLVRCHIAQASYDQAIGCARRWLALDPLGEPAHRALMRLYAWSDQRSAALRQYEECERSLEEELGVPPEPETTDLYDLIKERRDPPPPKERFTRRAASQPAVLKDRYRLESELGWGATGTVYRALDSQLERPVAVKLVPVEALGADSRARLLAEAQPALKLDHPHIASVFELGEADDYLFTVMELVEGESLARLESAGGSQPIALRQAQAIALQLCAALEHAHNLGIIHRDLKPENVLITDGGSSKLAGFGLNHPAASRLTGDGGLAGNVGYLAPELALGQEFDGRADLYALGAILYEMLTGSPPFAADDPVAVISQHLHAPVVPPRAREAGIPPALDDLIVRLLSKDPQDRPGSAAELLQLLDAPEVLDLDAAPAEEVSRLRRIGRGQLVGRKRELQEARTLWSRALAGQGQLLLVSGEAGVGKTRLVRELSTQVQVSGGRVLTGGCYAEGGAPYAPFAQILHQALEAGSEFDLIWPKPVLASLVTLDPSLMVQHPEIRPEADLDDPMAEQQRLFRNLTAVFTALSERAPLLLVVEDIHWADSGTLLLLRYLARHTRGNPLMIVAPFRDVEPDEARPLHEMLLDVDRERLAARLRLPRLDRDQTRDMLAALFAEEITLEFADGIYGETEGNPFFVEEVCKALVESGDLYYSDGGWQRPSMEELGIPQSVRAAIHSRVRVLPAATQDILQLAAVIGREFDCEVLNRAGEQDEDTLIEALDNAGRAQLIEQLSQERGGTFAFVHMLIPSTLVEDTRALRRRQLHRRAAVAIETVRAGDFEALAYHYGQAGEARKAAGYLLQAGDRARGLYAEREAIASYRQALEFLKQAGDLEQASRTLMKLGLTYHQAFDFKASREAYEEGFVLSQQAVGAQPESRAPHEPAPHALRITSFEPATLGPDLVLSQPSGLMIDQLFSGLVECNPDMDVVPDVAHSWQTLDGGRKYVFHLRDDVRWSDGVPVTAADFVLAWQRGMDPDLHPFETRARLFYDVLGARAYHQGETDDPGRIGVRALDDFTLVVDMEGPTSYFPYVLAFVHMFPVPRHLVEKHGSAWADPENIVTNGPFRLAAWEPGQRIVLERNPDYHGRFPGNLERVECPFLAGETAGLLQAYGEDQLDVCGGLSPAEWARARQHYAEEYISIPWLSIDFVGFDVGRPPFDDLRVRQAFTLATDRETLAHVALRAYSFPATGGFVPPGTPGHSPGIGLPYDPEGARQLLAEAGYPDGLDFPAVKCLARDDPGHDLLSEQLHKQWCDNLGVDIDWQEVEWNAFPGRMDSEKPHMWMAGWWADYPDPDDFLRVQWWLDPNWQNADFQRLVAEARRAMDQEARTDMYQQADQILVEEAPVLPLAYGRFHFLVKPWVKRYLTSPISWWFWKHVVIEPH